MSPSPSHHHNLWRLRLGELFLVGTMVVGCAAQPQESGKAADSVATTQEPAAAPSAPLPPQAQPQERAQEAAPSAPPTHEGVGRGNATGPGKPVPSPTVSERKRGASARPAAAAAGLSVPKSSKVDSSQVTPGRPSLDEFDAQPAYAEPPELTQALKEFETQWEALSTSRACDDACRAFESMRRSAQRICELVLDSDPRERCNTARARVEQASRDLSARCTTCK